MVRITYEKEPEDVPSEQKDRVKRWTPKVKTGCLTCRKRRIKCDERKPRCLNCEARRARCEYEIPQTRIFEYDPLKGKYIPPKSSNGITPVRRQPDFGDFTKEELRSLSFYLQRTGTIVTKYNSRYDFWTRILPSAVYDYPALKHCITALTLVDESITSPSASALIENRIEYHYSTAMKLTINETRTTAVLLVCVASFYLETLRSNDAALLMHLRSAKNIIDAEYATNPNPQEVVSEIKSVVDECLFFALALPVPPIDLPDYWEAPPTSFSAFSLDQAEYELSACVTNLCRPAGQFPLALVRANATLRQWQRDFVAVGGPFAAREQSVLALWNIAKCLIAAVQSLRGGHAGSAFESLTLQWQELREMDPPPVRLQKPLVAVERFVQKYQG